jgi:hypothetical protein
VTPGRSSAETEPAADLRIASATPEEIRNEETMPVKAFFALAALAAIAVGFALPAPHHAEAQQVAQVQTLDLDD